LALIDFLYFSIYLLVIVVPRGVGMQSWAHPKAPV
jgi:hypothetical protein